MPKKQHGFAPILIVILLAIIAGASVIVVKNISNFNGNTETPQPTVSMIASPSSNNSSNLNFSSPTPTSTSTPTSTPTPAFSQTPTPSPQATIPTIKITYPNDGETLKIGDRVTITWEASSSFSWSTFNIGYTDCPSCYSTIANTGGSNRSYQWTVGVGNTGDGPYSRQFKIKIIAYPTTWSGPTPTDESDSSFTVTK